MTRYLSDQNKVALLHESGTYGSTSGAAGIGIWVGEVLSNSISDQENKIEDRFLGNSSRSFGNFQLGPRDVDGTLTLNAQNFRFPFWAIGSTYDSSGTQSIHTATQIDTDVRQNGFTSGPLNPPMSFTLEDSKKAPGTGRNFVRTINGCVGNIVTVTASEGEKIKVEVNYIGQTVVPSSGTTSTITADNIKPYLWSSSTLTLAGSILQTPTEVSLEINNNLEAPHYLNGSRDISVPFMQNRDYTLNVDLDLSSIEADMLYNQYYKAGSTFNAVWDFNQDATTGSQHAIFTMSGCVITSFENPSEVEGPTKSTIEIRPKNVSATEYTSTASSSKFNPY